MDNDELKIYPIERLHEFSTRIFLHFGVPEADARLAADVLAASDLRGIDSHGVARLHTYFDMLSIGRINPRPRARVMRRPPARRLSTATTAWAWSSGRGPIRLPSTRPWPWARAG